jgi:hypothetical protein
MPELCCPDLHGSNAPKSTDAIRSELLAAASVERFEVKLIRLRPTSVDTG